MDKRLIVGGHMPTNGEERPADVIANAAWSPRSPSSLHGWCAAFNTGRSDPDPDLRIALLDEVT